MTTIKLKNGSGAPLAGDLVQGEPALDLTNKRLYTENSGGTVIEIGTNPTSLTTGTFTSTGIDDNATSTALTVTDSGIAATLTTAAQPNITSVGTLTGFTSTGIDDNASSTVMTIASSGETTFTGDVVISEATPSITLDDSDDPDGELQIVQSTGNTFYRTRGATGNGAHIFQRNNGTDTLKIFQTNASGDVIFYDDDGSTEGMRWDASASKLTNFTSTGIDDNATSTAITIDSAGDVDLSGSFKYGNSGISASDANTASQPGFYQTSDLSTATNWPATATGPGALVTIAGQNANNHTQLAFFHNSQKAFLRNLRSSNYKDWLQIITDDGSGNVGIGTADPSKPVHVLSTNSGATTTPLLLQNNQGAANGAVEIRLAPTGYPNDIGSTARWSAIRAINGGTGNPTELAFLTNNTSADPAERMRIDSSGNLLVGDTSTPTSSAGNIVLYNGTAPTGNATNGVILYAEDVSASSELKVRDEAGNVTTLSPHNFDLIQGGPSEDMAWSYYSERDGKRINVDMLKAIRLLEQLSGEKLVHIS